MNTNHRQHVKSVSHLAGKVDISLSGLRGMLYQESRGEKRKTKTEIQNRGKMMAERVKWLRKLDIW